MTSKESAIYWRTLARKYHEFGFNIVPLGGDKRPVVVGVSKTGGAMRFRWEDWSEVKQDGKLFDAIMEPAWWSDVKGIAAVCGPVSGNLICFDFDHCEQSIVTQFLRTANLPESYPWTVATPGGGWHVWVRTATTPDLAKGKVRRQVPDLPGAFVELRWTGHYTALPKSQHPTGNVYEWAFAVPSEGPAVVVI